MSKLHQRILDGFIHTQYWVDLNPKARQRVIDIVKEARHTMPPQGVRWVSNILNRGFTVLSMDPPAERLVPLGLKPSGGNTYTAKVPFKAGPRDLWLEYAGSYNIDIGKPIAEKVHELTSQDNKIMPGSQVDFNSGVITLVFKPGDRVGRLVTVETGGWERLKWYRRRLRVNREYSDTRVSNDLMFFSSSTNRGQIFSVLRTLNQAAQRNLVLRRLLDNFEFVDATGKDLPAGQAANQETGNLDVYTRLNNLMQHVSSLDKLPQGSPIMSFPNGSKWVTLDKKGDDTEAALMRHCLAGETEVLTDIGLVEIRTLAGHGAVVLTSTAHGTARWAVGEFSSYGTQALYRVALRNVKSHAVTHEVFATDGHRWLIRANEASETADATTLQLTPGNLVATAVPGCQLSFAFEVVSVTATGRHEEVFCAEVADTHCFTLAKGILVGNCGNKGGRDEDRLMSYRVPSQSIKGLFEPKLTFIYDPRSKQLGEAKGFANNKPDEKYHDVIVGLLSKPGLITALNGSGYLPHNNFSLNDLSAQRLADLFKANPELVKKMRNHGDQYQRLSKQSIDNLEKLVGPLDPKPEKEPAKKAKKTKKVED